MCYHGSDPAMAPLNEEHLGYVMQQAPHVKEFAQTTYAAWTQYLTPHLPLLPAFVAMYEQLQEERFGVLENFGLVRLPLSVIGEDKGRYRTPIISRLHDTILSARMSDISVEGFRKRTRGHGVCVLFLCSCGIVMGPCANVKKFYGSPIHINMDRLRSAIDAEGHPVIEVSSWSDIPERTMDLHPNGAERELFDRIDELTLGASHGVSTPDMPWIDELLEDFIEFIEQEHESETAA